MSWFNKKNKIDHAKILKQYDYLKEAIIKTFEEDENYTNLIDSNALLSKFGLTLDEEMNITKVTLDGKNTIPSHIYYEILLEDSDCSPYPGIAGIQTHGGLMTFDGDFIPTYSSKPLHEMEFKGYTSVFDKDLF